MDDIRNCPELHAALTDLAKDHVYLSAPPRDGEPRRYLPCNCCDSVFAIRATVVSATCADCQLPCADPECGLLVYQHTNGCEPIALDS